MTTQTRRAACRVTARKATVPLYAADMRPVRGRCLARKRKAVCGNRWGIVRVSIDMTDRASTDSLATVECALCGHTWRRCKVPERLTSHAGYQAVRLSLILPAAQRRWYARGRYHVTGEDAVTIPEATIPDYMAARDDWHVRNGTYAESRRKAALRKAEAEAEARASTAALIARLAERDAERDTAEAEAEARDAAA